MDTADAETRMIDMVLRFAETYGANVDIEFDSSELDCASHEWWLNGRKHRFIFSRVWLCHTAVGYPYDPSPEEQSLWEPYGIMCWENAEWALVIHECAHALQAKRDVMCYTPDHGTLWSTCVRELQAQFPPPQPAGWADHVS